MKFVWAEALGKAECPYIVRYCLDFGLFSIRLHHWLSSDDQRNFHDHPWWFFTIVLKGSYTDISPNKSERMTVGKFAFRRALHRHTVKVDKGGCWTLLITGPEKRIWGFWVNGKFRKRNKYFYMFGDHPCDS